MITFYKDIYQYYVEKTLWFIVTCKLKLSFIHVFFEKTLLVKLQN